jgi:hypothetical protein
VRRIRERRGGKKRGRGHPDMKREGRKEERKGEVRREEGDIQ